jgi:S-disulfanyl-L-cysteine oxidoreductase SoxD
MLRREVLLGLTMTLGVLAFSQVAHYGLGRRATAEEIHAQDISVSPTGAGLPRGHGTAIKGRAVYRSKCASCHGERGQGDAFYAALVDGQGTLNTSKPVLTVGTYWPYATTVWDYIHRSMPYQRPGTLRTDETYAVTAYILYLNGIVDQKQDLNSKHCPK